MVPEKEYFRVHLKNDSLDLTAILFTAVESSKVVGVIKQTLKRNVLKCLLIDGIFCPMTTPKS